MVRYFQSIINCLSGYLKNSFYQSKIFTLKIVFDAFVYEDFEVLHPYEVSCGTKYVFVHLCLRVGSFNFNLITLNLSLGK